MQEIRNIRTQLHQPIPASGAVVCSNISRTSARPPGSTQVFNSAGESEEIGPVNTRTKTALLIPSAGSSDKWNGAGMGCEITFRVEFAPQLIAVLDRGPGYPRLRRPAPQVN